MTTDLRSITLFNIFPVYMFYKRHEHYTLRYTVYTIQLWKNFITSIMYKFKNIYVYESKWALVSTEYKGEHYADFSKYLSIKYTFSFPCYFYSTKPKLWISLFDFVVNFDFLNFLKASEHITFTFSIIKWTMLFSFVLSINIIIFCNNNLKTIDLLMLLSIRNNITILQETTNITIHMYKL